MTPDEAAEIIGANEKSFGVFGADARIPGKEAPGENLSFDYLKGRVLKVDISGDELETQGYDRDNGQGAAARAIDAVRRELGLPSSDVGTPALDVGTPDTGRASDSVGILANPRQIDLSVDDYSQKLATAPIYRKKAVVSARAATPGEIVVTTLADGTQETTSRVAEEGDWVVRNPGGERYLVSAEKFASRFEATDQFGRFQATGRIRAIPNATGGPIVVKAPWDEYQFGDPNCVLAATIGADDKPSKDRYIIGRAEFTATYAPEASLSAHGVPSQDLTGGLSL